MHPRATLLWGAAWLLAGCAANPVTGKSDYVLMSEQQEVALGQRYNRQILKEMPPYEDAKLNGLVQSIGEQLADQVQAVLGSHRDEDLIRSSLDTAPRQDLGPDLLEQHWVVRITAAR